MKSILLALLGVIVAIVLLAYSLINVLPVSAETTTSVLYPANGAINVPVSGVTLRGLLHQVLVSRINSC